MPKGKRDREGGNMMDEQKKKPRWWAELLSDVDHRAFQHPGGLMIFDVIVITIALVCTVINVLIVKGL